MILLAFTVRNHKSIQNEITVDLMRPSFKTLQPKDGDWGAVCFPLVGIFGGNATGKSAVLSALLYAFDAIRSSATSWQDSRNMKRAPFLLDGKSHLSSSLYELDVVHNDRRYLYGFEVDHDGIKREWLQDIPSLRWRTLLERDRDKGSLTFHQSVRSKMEVTPRELVLSRALLLRESPFHDFARDLVKSFDIVLVKDSHREARLRSLPDSLAKGEITFDDLETLLEVADIGVLSVSIEERNIPESFRRKVDRIARILRDEEAEDPAQASVDLVGQQEDELVENELEQVIRHLMFNHRGASEDRPALSIRDESDGTIAWLAIAVPALEALRSGGLLLVDEIDASLHPHLLDVILGAFANPLVNIKHAQLIFTSHESHILSPLSEVRLEPEQVWFTDKALEGETKLACLADFPRHPDANVAKRYLTGRYGGTPRLSPSLFALLVESI